MFNSKLHEAGSSFGGNFSAQSQSEIQHFTTETAPPEPDSVPSEKLEKVTAENQDKTGENLYFCHHLTGGAAHPGIVVETAGLANIKPPRPTYRPQLPNELLTSGKISEIQLERIIYAG